MQHHDRAPMRLQLSEVLGDASEYTQKRLGHTALELTSVITPEEYGELYLMAHGYLIGDSCDLQQAPAHAVQQQRNSLREKIVGNSTSTKQSGNVIAVARSIDIGFLPNPALHPDEGVLAITYDVQDSLGLIQLIGQGSTDPEIARCLGMSTNNVAAATRKLAVNLNANKRTHLIYRSYQAGLLEPSAPEMTLPSSYAERLNALEAMRGGPVVSLLRTSTRQQGFDRFEALIITMLKAPDYAIYHPQLATYMQKTQGYSKNQWRNLINKLGPVQGNGIIKLAQTRPGTNQAAHGMDLMPRGLSENRYKKRRGYLTDRVFETYDWRLRGGREKFALDTDHLGVRLNSETDAGLEPALRTAIALTHPVIEQTVFPDSEAFHKTLSTFTGLTSKELHRTVAALKQLDLVEFHGDTTHVVRLITKKGKHIVDRGITLAKEQETKTEPAES